MLIKSTDNDTIKEIISKFPRDRSMAEFICEILKDRLIEIYLGDGFEQINTEQISTNVPAVFCGRVFAAFKECLMIDSAFMKNGNISFGNIIMINERSIRAINLVDGDGTIGDLFLKSKKTVDLLESFEKYMRTNK